MRVLFDMTHPVHVHWFKYLISTLSRQGHQVLVTARDKDVILPLLADLGIPHICISKRRTGLFGAATELLIRDVRLLRAARRFRPDLLVAAAAGVFIGPVGAILAVPRLVFDQVDLAWLQRSLGMPWATLICTSDTYLKDHRRRHIRFRGFLAQAYLDPRYFKPDPDPLCRAGIDLNKPFIVLRLVRWSATHDIGRKGLTGQQLERFIERLSQHARVLVSSEEPLPNSLKKYENPVPAAHLHDLLAFAALCVAEGGTVAPEAGILGTPAICYNTYDFGYLQALEKQYKLIHRSESLPQALETAKSFLQNDKLSKQWQRRRDKLFEQTDDVSSFMRRMIDRTVQMRP